MPSDFVDKIAEILPVKQAYNDALSPAAKQVGAFAEDLTKTIRLALFPVQFGSALQDRFLRFIDKSVRNVPEDKRVAPPPQIIGPVLEGIRYEPEDTPIDEMFSALLSNSMDQDHHDKAHPSFPIIIRQLSGDEVIILYQLHSQDYTRIKKLDINKYKKTPDDPDLINFNIEKEIDFVFDKLAIQKNFAFYTEHLFHLGLACFTEMNQEVIRNETGETTGFRIFEKYHLMPLGCSFVKACIRDDK